MCSFTRHTMDGRGREASRGRQTETKGGSPHPGTSVQRESSKAVYILYSPPSLHSYGTPNRIVSLRPPRLTSARAYSATRRSSLTAGVNHTRSARYTRHRRGTPAVAKSRARKDPSLHSSSRTTPTPPHRLLGSPRGTPAKGLECTHTHTLPDSPTPALETTRQNRTSSDPDGSVAERPCTRASPPVQDTLPSPPEKTYKVRILSTVSRRPRYTRVPEMHRL